MDSQFEDPGRPDGRVGRFLILHVDDGAVRIADLLADETPNMDLAGQCLPSLKLLLDQTLSAQVPAINATSEKVIHGLLGACLSNIDDMRYVSV